VVMQTVVSCWPMELLSRGLESAECSFPGSPRTDACSDAQGIHSLRTDVSQTASVHWLGRREGAGVMTESTRVLVVDDEKSLTDLIALALRL